MRKLKQQFCSLLACAACMLTGIAPAAADVVIVDNSPPNHLTGNNMGFAFQAEDFSLSAGTTLTGLHFWSLEGDSAYRGSISWSIMSNGSGGPGATTLASGNQSSVMRTALGSYLGLNEYANHFALNAPLALGAGTYWLVLHNGPNSNLGDPNEFVWESAANNATMRGAERFDLAGAWTTNGTEHAFQILAVPEPAQVLMLLAGLTLAAGLRRREQRSERFV